MSEHQDPRDVVVILCDQLRCDFLSLYGCRAIPTPNLDRLAREGVVFDRAITASAVCGPARASMMTGLYPAQHGVWTNDLPFRPGLRYLPECMNELGYHTGAFGKLHHAPALDAKGFGTARQMEEGRLGADEPYFKWLQTRHPEVTDIWNTDYTPQTMQFRFAAEEHYEYWIASQAIDWMASIAADQPLFAWVSFQGPHGPWNPPRELRGCCDAALLPRVRTDKEGGASPIEQHRTGQDPEIVAPPLDPVRDNEAIRVSYAEMIAFSDRQIGRVLEALDKNGRLENTTIIFSADHGDMLGDFGLWGKGALSRSAQLSVPLVIANHPDLTPGSKSEALTGNLDIPGTVLDIAGAPLEIGLSRSLLDLMGPEPKQARAANFSELGDGIKIVETAAYRYCYYPFSGCGELLRLDGCADERVTIEGSAEYEAKEREFLKHLLDFEALKNGVLIRDAEMPPTTRARILHTLSTSTNSARSGWWNDPRSMFSSKS
ncbi:MAG: sulfatase-like hydrolase/transferase [Lentisphaeria bacterium]|nr:sulfatase-like hydrolase/transferase [Lentisphaeria bacterium]